MIVLNFHLILLDWNPLFKFYLWGNFTELKLEKSVRLIKSSSNKIKIEIQLYSHCVHFKIKIGFYSLENSELFCQTPFHLRLFLNSRNEPL